MPVSNSSAVWKGNLVDGNGTMKLGKGGYEGPVHQGIAVRERRGHQSRGTDRRGPRGLLLDVPVGHPLEERFPASRNQDDGQGASGRRPGHHADRTRDRGDGARLRRGRVPWSTPRRPRPAVPVSKALSAVPMKLTATLVK